MEGSLLPADWTAAEKEKKSQERGPAPQREERGTGSKAGERFKVSNGLTKKTAYAQLEGSKRDIRSNKAGNGVFNAMEKRKDLRRCAP